MSLDAGDIFHKISDVFSSIPRRNAAALSSLCPLLSVFDEDAEGADVVGALFVGGKDAGFKIGVEWLEHEDAVVVDFDFFQGGVVAVDVDGHDGAVYPVVAKTDDGDGAVVDDGFHALTFDTQGEVVAVAQLCFIDVDIVVGVDVLHGGDGGAAGDAAEDGQAFADVDLLCAVAVEEGGWGGVQGAGDDAQFGLADVVFAAFDFGDGRAAAEADGVGEFFLAHANFLTA